LNKIDIICISQKSSKARKKKRRIREREECGESVFGDNRDNKNIGTF